MAQTTSGTIVYTVTHVGGDLNVKPRGTSGDTTTTLAPRWWGKP